MNQKGIWLVNLDPTLGAEIKNCLLNARNKLTKMRKIPFVRFCAAF